MHMTLVGRAALDDYFLRKTSSSQLMLLSDAAYEAGLERMRARIAEAEARGEQAQFQSHIMNRMWRGTKRP
jgi:hypothetical protein